ncbi:precorrin-8X methylmutase [Solidesulfovibrio magneticus]|uniref:Cobalt-precorrin-8X methylmutase n=1 Tax=Solidesulfovibrio magneticus (strain ATCC 700980 / DSM 13731 / RS-1) TaxID=573370 RepID=C4XI34_SOLM1|nr:precorrin-8X methylmutase [Solidesulfovibrio magneticus]BAH73996.1 cobalt-precorrin-8X methylmutase [Solidesulfovibrio magneticus RS-1]
MPHTSPIQPIFAPDAIEAASLAIIDSEVPEPRPYDGPRWDVVRRLIHTTADFELLDLVRFSEGSVREGIRAIEAGATIVTDTEMARCAIPPRRLAPFGCAVRCFMNDPEVAAAAKAAGSTRAALAVDFALDLPGPLIFVIGNAPTALLRLLSRIDGGASAPALVVGMPVGFVNAAQSKALLMTRADLAWIAIAGRKGGSALAGATINALAILAGAKTA